jgi:hypothetical protein
MKMSSASSSARSKAKASVAPSIDPAFVPVAAAFARDGDVGLGRMFSSNSVLNFRGKIFAMFVKGKFVAKLPKARVDDLVASGVGEHFDPGHGRLMKEWVALADARGTWVALAKEARAFAAAARR